MAYEPPHRSGQGAETTAGGGHAGAVYGNGNGNGHGSPRTPGGGEQIREVLHVVFKRWRLIALLFIAVAIPGIVTVMLRKPVYVATAKVMISTQRTDPTLQPTDVTRLDTVQLNESLVNSEVHVISSRNLLEQVVLSLAPVRDPSGVPLPGANGASFGGQVLALSQGLGVTPIKASNVIQIDYRSPDPKIAARIVNRVVDEYLSYHAAVHGTKGLPRFYDEQRRALEQSLRKAEDALVTFAEAEGVVAPRDEIQTVVREVGEVSAALREVTTNIVGVEERIRAVRDQLATQPEVVKRSQHLETNPVITQLNTQLVDRQVDRAMLLRKYTEDDRRVRDNADEIAELQALVDAEARTRPTIVEHQVFRTNPIREDRLHTLLDLESQLREMRAREATLDEELGRVNRRLLTLQQKRVTYEQLEQEAQTRRDTYDLYVRREQEARISQAMDDQKLVNVDIVQRPSLPLPRVDTQGTSVALSLIAGLVVGLAGAFGREYVSRSLRSESDVERHLGLPLLASVDESPNA